MEVPAGFDDVWVELERRLRCEIRPEVRRWAEAKYGDAFAGGDSQTRLTVLEMLQQDLARMRVGGVEISPPGGSLS